MESSESPAPKPPRRPRYRGTHPRHFHEKYKERDPSRDPETFQKVLASGKTPAGTHRPIMVREILEVLRVQPGERVVDATLGYGGHAAELLAAVQPGGRLLALDQDPVELPKTEARLRALGFPEESLVVRRLNFAGLAGLVGEFGEADALLADLGLSSMQIDDPLRGFTFKTDVPLDMRMNPTRGLSAAALLAKSSAAEITRWLVEHSDEPQALPLGEALAAERPQTSGALAALVRRIAAEEAIPRVFQAIRIAVNDEFSALEMFLRRLPACLRPGGRVAILTFHSGEDRRVKHALRDGERAGLYAATNHTVGRASPEEQRTNPRSSPAKLRWAIRA